MTNLPVETVRKPTQPSDRFGWIWDVLLVVILLGGAYFRFVGFQWDETQHLHPDERFLTMVETGISPVDSLSEYFDTARSSLNPANSGNTFYVYGTLPLFMVRYVAEWIGMTGYDQVNLVGRFFSAMMDLLTVLLVYLTVLRLYKNPRMGILAAALMAVAVQPIQQSHFFTTDNFVTFFVMLTVFFGIVVATQKPRPLSEKSLDQPPLSWIRYNWRTFTPYAFFGFALGCAMASKVSAAPVALLLPLAALIYYLNLSAEDRDGYVWVLWRNLILAGMVAFLVFRVFQPYAFNGPGFFGLSLNQQWIGNLRELSNLSGGDVDFPPALQWARRPLTFAWSNMVTWGMGLPLGILAWVGFLWMGWRILHGEWKQHLLLWSWTGAYFLWQSVNFTRAMRYQLPIYPSLIVIAAWFAWWLWDKADKAAVRRALWKTLTVILAASVLVASGLWAYAFTRIYTRPHTRIEASRWIYENVPGPINLKIHSGETEVSQALSFPDNYQITPSKPYVTSFIPKQSGWVGEVSLPNVTLQSSDGLVLPVNLRVELLDEQQTILGDGRLALTEPGQRISTTLALSPTITLDGTETYALRFSVEAPASLVSLDGQVSLDIHEVAGIQALPVANLTLAEGQPQVFNFTSSVSGEVGYVRLPTLVDASVPDMTQVFVMTLVDYSDIGVSPIFTPEITLPVRPGETLPVMRFEPQVSLIKGHEYALSIETRGPVQFTLQGDVEILLGGDYVSQILPPVSHLIDAIHPYQTVIFPKTSGLLSSVTIPHLVEAGVAGESRETIRLTLTAAEDNQTVLAQSSIRADFRPTDDARGETYEFLFSQPVNVIQGNQYLLTIELQGAGAVALRGSAPANESTWDDGLPLRLDGYDAYGGLYQRDLVFEMYWDDNPEKLERFVSTLDQADYLFISSNRQWGTTIRVPERYPLTSEYYRLLVGCPEDADLFACYADAQPGQVNEQLGFELVKVFQGSPNLGNWTFNTQYAEEAFTVYDNPKVMIFKKTQDFDINTVNSLLSVVDLTEVIHLTPLQASERKHATLMLDASRRETEQAGGTWSQIFDTNALYNQHPWMAVALWYLVVTLLGWVVYPMVRLGFGGLKDKGFPLTKLVGLLLLAWLTWLAGSAQIPVTRLTISGAVLLLILANGWLFWRYRSDILAEIRQNWRLMLTVELVAIGFFLLDLLIRFGNPDLWHPWKGGEKPMDFSYFNAVLKSTTFPPYDPWFAGGYINYYYYGFVVVGVLVKWLGIVPAIAYNIVIPGMFMTGALGAFSFGWNILHLTRKGEAHSEFQVSPLGAGLMSAFALMVIGNLGSVRMIWQGFQKLAAPGGLIENANIIQGVIWFVKGVGQYFQGAHLPYAVGDWYWIPSRVMPAEPITEFPFFTYIYADLHAHLLALPITILVLVWSLSMLAGKWSWQREGRQWDWLRIAVTFGLGGLVIGALRLTNTWDLPVYLVLAMLATGYTVLRYGQPVKQICQVSAGWQRALMALAAMSALAGLAFVMYAPYGQWYIQGYNALDWWTGTRTPMKSYTTHWGLFLFILLTWLVWELREWSANLPATVLLRLKPYRMLIYTLLIAMVLLCILLLVIGVSIAWVVLLVGTLTVVLLLRPDLPDAKRFVLFMVGTGMALTLAVELVVLAGDIGRMNTVFKFYIQAWSLLGLSAAAGLCWLLPAVWERWSTRWANLWQIGLILLVFGAALFPVLGGADKIRDRMVAGDKPGLDGLAFMTNAKYYDMDKELDLSIDYRGIRWMQENVQGSPVIVEANTVEYKWGSRYTIYTGLPGVVGWNWHQRQQRGSVVPSEWVQNRVDEIGRFYNSTDRTETLSFLSRYNVKYIIVGELEQAYYSAEGLAKFTNWNGELWTSVYSDGPLTIYKVISD